MNYLNAARWENDISKHLSDLEEFYLKYITSFGDGYQPLMYQGKKNEFFSSFWCQRQWLLEIEIDSEEITYYIHPYKKRWYEFTKSKQLILSNIYQEAFHQTLTILDYLEHILPVMQIDHLDIQQQIFIVKLGEILNLLPDLDSLKLGTISISYPRSVTEEELFGSYYLISQNKVTKLCLERIDRFEEIYFIISLCPRIQKLRINFLKKMNIELFVRSFFTEVRRREIQTLKSLCFCVPIVDDKMMKKLETMIKNENLLLDFSMKRMMNQIYIQWK
ncbi:hypothetical protein I4U23_015782 [Adineta vaga]|nr:hypothetical protein I4U23_015782 [Adineta vaga]